MLLLQIFEKLYSFTTWVTKLLKQTLISPMIHALVQFLDNRHFPLFRLRLIQNVKTNIFGYSEVDIVKCT